MTLHPFDLSRCVCLDPGWCSLLQAFSRLPRSTPEKEKYSEITVRRNTTTTRAVNCNYSISWPWLITPIFSQMHFNVSGWHLSSCCVFGDKVITVRVEPSDFFPPTIRKQKPSGGQRRSPSTHPQPRGKRKSTTSCLLANANDVTPNGYLLSMFYL